MAEIAIGSHSGGSAQAAERFADTIVLSFGFYVDPELHRPQEQRVARLQCGHGALGAEEAQ